MADGASRLAVAAHPVAVGALVVLVVNDHVLKAWSGPLEGGLGVVARTATGKASDLAGVLLLAVWLGALGGRRRPAVAAVAVGFAALKLSPLVAELAVPVLGGRTRTDPSDLLALVALLPADRILRPLDAARSLDVRPAWASLRATLGLAVVVVSVPAMTSSSCGERSDEVAGPRGTEVLAARADGSIVRFVAEGDRGDREPLPPTADEPGTWWISTDDGDTWREEPRPEAEARSLQREWRRTEGCTADSCYRLARDAQVVEEGASDRTTHLFSAGDRAAMAANEDGCDGSGEHDASAVEIAVTDDVAVVNVPPYGLVRNEGDGWEHVDTPWGERASDLPRAWPRHLVYAPIVGIAALSTLQWLSAIRSPRRSRLRPLSSFIAALGGFLAAAVVFFGQLGYPSERTQGLRIGAATGIVFVLAALPLVRLLVWPQAEAPTTGSSAAPRPGPPGRPPPPDPADPPPTPPPPPGPSGWI